MMPKMISNPLRPLPRETALRACGIVFAVAALTLMSLPAQNLKLPTLPKGFFKKDTDELQETAQAPAGPAGMCLLPSGEYILSCHQFFQPPFRVMKFDREGNWSPFPNEAMNTPGSGDPIFLDSVLGVACDSRGIVWMLDNGRRSGTAAKLVAWDTKRDEHFKSIVIDALALSPNSFLTNIALDPVGRYIYIADPADGFSSAIIVVDIQTGLTRRVLERDRSVQMDPGVDLKINGHPIEVRRPDGVIATPLTGVYPLAVDRKGEWLYYGPRNGSSLFKVRTELLTDPAILPHVLTSQVTGVSPKPICDSMAIDSRGRIYFGDISRGSIDYVAPEENFLNLRLLVEDPRLMWPGGLAIGPDGLLHFFSSQLHRTPFFNSGKDVTTPPFSIFKARPLPAGRFGLPGGF
jgi:sugar lactone lactonase YvrE